MPHVGGADRKGNKFAISLGAEQFLKAGRRGKTFARDSITQQQRNRCDKNREQSEMLSAIMRRLPH